MSDADAYAFVSACRPTHSLAGLYVCWRGNERQLNRDQLILDSLMGSFIETYTYT